MFSFRWRHLLHNNESYKFKKLKAMLTSACFYSTELIWTKSNSTTSNFTLIMPLLINENVFCLSKYMYMIEQSSSSTGSDIFSHNWKILITYRDIVIPKLNVKKSDTLKWTYFEPMLYLSPLPRLKEKKRWLFERLYIVLCNFV